MSLMMIILSVLQTRFGFDNYLVPEQPRWSISRIVDDAFHYIAPQSMLDTYHQFAGCSLYSVSTAVVSPCPLEKAACISTPTGNWDCEASAFVTAMQVPLQQERQCINYNYTDNYNSEELLLTTAIYNPTVVEFFSTLPGHADAVSMQTVILSNIINADPTKTRISRPPTSTLDIQLEKYGLVYSIIVIGVVLFCWFVLIGIFAWRFLKPRSKPETPSIPLRERQVDPNPSLSNVYMLNVRKVNTLSHSRQRELRKSRLVSNPWIVHARRLKKLRANSIADQRKLRKNFNRLNKKHASVSKEFDSMKQQMNKTKDEVQKLKKQNALLDHDCAELNVKLAFTETSLEGSEYEKHEFEQKLEASETMAAKFETDFEAAAESNKALKKRNAWLDQQLQSHQTCHTDVEFQKLRNSHANSTLHADHQALQDAHKSCLNVFEVQKLRNQVQAKEQLLLQEKSTHKVALLEAENERAVLRSREEGFQQRLIKLQNTNGSDLMKLKAKSETKLKAETDRANELETVNQELSNQLESQKQLHAQELHQAKFKCMEHLKESQAEWKELEMALEDERRALKNSIEEHKVEYSDLFDQSTEFVAQRDAALAEVANLKASASETTSDGFSEVEQKLDTTAAEATDLMTNASELATHNSAEGGEQHDVAATEGTDSTTNNPEPVLDDPSEPEEQHDAHSEVKDLEANHTQPVFEHLDETDMQQDATSANVVDREAELAEIDKRLAAAPKAPKADIMKGVPTQPKGYHATFMSSDARKRPTRRGGLEAAMKRRGQAAAAAVAAPHMPFTPGHSNLMVNSPQPCSSSVPFNPTGTIAATTQLSAAAFSFVPSPTNQVSKTVGSTSNINGGLNASKWAN